MGVMVSQIIGNSILFSGLIHLAQKETSKLRITGFWWGETYYLGKKVERDIWLIYDGWIETQME